MTINNDNKDPKAILAEYLDKLDEGLDDTNLLKQLCNLSSLSEEAPSLYEQALLAQLLFCKRLAQSRMPKMEEAVLEMLEKADASQPAGSIWVYLNNLVAAKGLYWGGILKDLKINPGLSGQIMAGSMDIRRFNPNDLAEIAKKVDADPSNMVRLVYRELNKECDVDSNLAVSYYRLLNSDNTSFSIISSKDNKHDEMLEYIKALQEALS